MSDTTYHGVAGSPAREFRAAVRLDLHTVRGMLKIAAGLIAVATVVAIAGGSVLTPAASVVSVMVVAGLMGQVEASNLRLLYGSLPLGRSTVLAAHYAVALCCVPLSAVPGLAGWLTAVVRQQPGAVEQLHSTVAIAGTVLILLAILLPAYVKWGSQRAGTIVMLGAFSIGGLGYAAAQLGARLPADASLPTAWLPSIVVVVGLAAVAVSYAVARRIYQRQDH